MRKLIDMIDRAKGRQVANWKRRGHVIQVTLGKTAREQQVYASLDGDDYVFTSVVLGSAAVTRRRKRWNRLALLAWQRNAEHQLITFAFDRRDRLVGQIKHPKDDLDLEELELYVNVLARDCDRFEYLLTGQDRY